MPEEAGVVGAALVDVNGASVDSVRHLMPSIPRTLDQGNIYISPCTFVELPPHHSITIGRLTLLWPLGLTLEYYLCINSIHTTEMVILLSIGCVNLAT